MWLLAPHVSLTLSRQVRAQLQRSACICQGRAVGHTAVLQARNGDTVAAG